jgi:hypothetical protein
VFPADFAVEVAVISGKCFAAKVAVVAWTDALPSEALADALPLLSCMAPSLLATNVLG